MAKETLPPNGLPKDQGISPLALKTIGDMTPKQFKYIAKIFDNIEKTRAIIEIKNMTPNQVEERANELGFRVTKDMTLDTRGRKPSEDDPIISFSYIVTCPRALPLLPRKKEHIQGVTDHTEAFRKVLEKRAIESIARHSQLLPASIDVQPNSFDRNLVTAIVGRKYSATASNASGQWEPVIKGRFRHTEDARRKAKEKVDRINRKRVAQKYG